MEQSVIFGVDPGSRVTGLAVLKQTNSGKPEVIACDTLRLDHTSDHVSRLRFLYKEITQYITRYNPTSCAVETPVYGKDPQAMLKLGRAQAAAILAITNMELPVSEYMPKAVKKSITGNGNAAKEQVAYMLSTILELPDKKLSSDATDALAVAWCHLMKGGESEVEKSSGKSVSSWGDFARNNPDRIK